MNNPMFSVIIPAHNEELRIGRALQSVIDQTYTDYQLIVVCDACTDGTAETANAFGADVIEIDSHSEASARNAGLDDAFGKWILFLDADDWFMHEYCFQYLADTLGKYNEDVLDFGFVQVGKGYMIPSADNSFGMAWCRAWKRSFIGQNRFDDIPYGCDSEFYDRLVKNNPDCKRAYCNMPIYYYNYMRKGSMTDLKENGAKFDIIITHYNEPWEVGKKLFDSIQMQECVNFSNINVILVQDGEGGALPWHDLLKDYTFPVQTILIKKHSRVAVARNVGIEKATSDWVMFMDFDDMFADIASISMLARIFPVDDNVDIIWSKYVREVKDYTKPDSSAFNCEDECDFRLIGKLFRRAFLNEHHIRFPDTCHEYSDMMFNTIAAAETYPHRIMSFYAPFYPYFKRHREDGYFSTLANLERKIALRFIRDAKLADEMRSRGKMTQHFEWIARAIADSYHTICRAYDEPDDNHGITQDLIEYWEAVRDKYAAISKNDIEMIMDISQMEAMTYIQEYYNHFRTESYLQNDMMSLDDFTGILDSEAFTGEKLMAEPSMSVREQESPELPSSKYTGERIVVYCGTKETYINMIASVKSLLATTPVDKVYFLIEDDEFPYPLPSIIETINVKDAHPFSKDGPNYDNPWTYMCMMRILYPNMFSQYDRVLSLDIDVVITEDISDLWDLDLTGYYYAGVPEQGREKECGTDPYANFGVIMFNLQKLREDNMQSRIVEAVNTEHFCCPEQDAYNKFCRGHILVLPNDYNVTVYSHITGEALHEKILHYAGIKYWKHFGPVKKYYNMSWDELTDIQEKLHE